jgi:purine-cytosine permease-like protein
MSHRGRSALYYGFVALVLATVLIAPFFSPTLERMSLVPHSALGGAVTFALVTLYQGVAAKMGALPFRPAKWIVRLFRVSKVTP